MLWEKTLPGKPPRRTTSGCSRAPAATSRCRCPSAGTSSSPSRTSRLAKDNEFGLPAGPYYVNNGLDPVTGKRHGTWIRVAQGPSVEVMNRAYDLDTGKPTRDERFDYLKSGGKAAGAKTEEWWRKIERHLRRVGQGDEGRGVPVRRVRRTGEAVGEGEGVNHHRLTTVLRSSASPRGSLFRSTLRAESRRADM